ncbi:MAG: hypothetical protein K0R31_1699, partial [Clostridiales bacterium]|nr:hypothetical protein [Clostridiales bacterium]
NPDLKHTVAFEEALIECRAQVEKCIRLLGKSPDTTWIQDDSPVERARRQVCDEYGIVYGFAKKVDRKTRQEMQPSEKYKHLNMYMPTQHDSVYKILYSDFAEARAAYDPVKYFVEDTDHLLEKETCITAWHPGYLDSFVYKDSSKHFNLARPMDIAALCSEELKQWIKDNKVQLVNHRDALFGTREYQNHLKAVNSDLAV